MKNWEEKLKKFVGNMYGYARDFHEEQIVVAKDLNEIESFIRQTHLDLLEEVIGFVKNIEKRIYPKDVFIPPSDGVFMEIHEFLKKKGGTLDAISADYARRNIRLVARELESLLESKKEEYE